MLLFGEVPVPVEIAPYSISAQPLTLSSAHVYLGNLIKRHPAETERPGLEKQEHPAPLKAAGQEKRAVTISRLREAFSLRQAPENKPRGAKTADSRRVSPRQKGGAPGPLCSRTRISEPREEGVASARAPSDPMGPGEASEEASGHSSASAGSGEGPSAPETGSHPSSDPAASAPEDGFSKEHVESCEEAPAPALGALDQEAGGLRRPQPPNASSPNPKRFKKEGVPLNPDVPPEPVATQSVAAAEVDVAVDIEKKIVPLDFSMRSLANRIKQLCHQEQQREGEQNYRKFRAKICPGENQAAEDELRKEIR